MRLQPDGRRHKPRTEDTLSWDVPFSVSGRIGVSILHPPTLYALIATAPLSDEHSGFYHLERGGRIIIHQMLCSDDGTGPFPVAAFTHSLNCRVSNWREFISTRSPPVRV
jgi:hypothetical protein